MFKLDGRVALVSGAGSARGLGISIAEALGAQGAMVVICDINEEGVVANVKRLEEQGVKAKGYTADVTKMSTLEAMVDDVIKTCGKIDILVNNAGITQKKKFDEMTEDDWNLVINIDLNGVFRMIKVVLPVMLKNNYGRIVNMSSVSAKRGGGVFGGSHYSAAKAGILALSKAIVREIGEGGVTVNSVNPGICATDIRGGVESEAEQKRLSADVPLKRMGRPEEIAATVCFLASDESAYITGEDIDINGGSHMD